MSIYKTAQGAKVEAQRIAGFETDSKTSAPFVVFADGTKQPRPLTHGFIPRIGDFWVREFFTRTYYTKQGVKTYDETGFAEIVPQDVFKTFYTEMPSNDTPTTPSENPNGGQPETN